MWAATCLCYGVGGSYLGIADIGCSRFNKYDTFSVKFLSRGTTCEAKTVNCSGKNVAHKIKYRSHLLAYRTNLFTPNMIFQMNRKAAAARDKEEQERDDAEVEAADALRESGQQEAVVNNPYP